MAAHPSGQRSLYRDVLDLPMHKPYFTWLSPLAAAPTIEMHDARYGDPAAEEPAKPAGLFAGCHQTWAVTSSPPLAVSLCQLLLRQGACTTLQRTRHGVGAPSSDAHCRCCYSLNIKATCSLCGRLSSRACASAGEGSACLAASRLQGRPFRLLINCSIPNASRCGQLVGDVRKWEQRRRRQQSLPQHPLKAAASSTRSRQQSGRRASCDFPTATTTTRGSWC